jgi:glycosyltransferase involved in cell wall biosynthesis
MRSISLVPFAPPFISQLNTAGTELHLVAIGKLVSRKRLDKVLASYIAYRLAHPGRASRLSIIVQCLNQSHDRRLGDLRDQVKRSQLAHEIVIYQNLNLSDVKAVLDSANVFVLFSENEPAAISPLEAAASSCAVLLSESGGTAHYFTNLLSCLHLSETQNSLIEALDYCGADPLKRQKLQAHAHQVAERLYKGHAFVEYVLMRGQRL